MEDNKVYRDVTIVRLSFYLALAIAREGLVLIGGH